MKLAVVAGGWHWPLHFFREMSEQSEPAELFVVAHRSPELAVVREEKLEILQHAKGPLADLDRELYRNYPTIDQLESLGWNYQEAPNTVGDWGFFNQWLDTHNYRDYHMILNCHDDIYLRSCTLLADVMRFHSHWLLLANGKYPEAPAGYVRGSFEFWSRELLDLLGGRIDLGRIKLTREGLTDSPKGMEALSPWNDTGVPLRCFLRNHRLTSRIGMLSPYYRISPWVIEGERGFLHFASGASWSFLEGVQKLAPELVA